MLSLLLLSLFLFHSTCCGFLDYIVHPLCLLNFLSDSHKGEELNISPTSGGIRASVIDMSCIVRIKMEIVTPKTVSLNGNNWLIWKAKMEDIIW